MARTSFFRPSKGLLAGIIVVAIAILVLLLTLLALSNWSGLPYLGADRNTMPSRPITTNLIPNPYSSGDFAYKNGYLTCISGKSELGVDVSVYQKQIDWPTVAQQGISFAMVRLGYRGYGQEGILKEDVRAIENLDGAKAAGLKVGAYFYSQAISVEEAIEEANMALEILDGRALEMPLVFDWEVFSQEGRTYYVDRKTVNECAMAFCQTVEAAGYKAMIYFNVDIANRLLDLPKMQEAGYPFWLAMYTGSGSMTYPHRVDMWQFTDTGHVKGIDADVDLNLYFTYE